MTWREKLRNPNTQLHITGAFVFIVVVGSAIASCLTGGAEFNPNFLDDPQVTPAPDQR